MLTALSHLTAKRKEKSRKTVGSENIKLRSSTYAGTIIECPLWDGGDFTIYLSNEEARDLAEKLLGVVDKADAIIAEPGRKKYAVYRDTVEPIPCKQAVDEL